jgi:hypothetical protein
LPAIAAATREAGWTGEVLGLRKGGSIFPRWVSTSPIRDPEGRLIGMLSVSRDITERKQAEEALQQRLEELERFQRATVQREFRIKELKDEIERLKGKP